MKIKFKRRRSRPVWLDAQQPLQQWYATSLGQSIAERLEVELNDRLRSVFGYQGLQVGNLVPGLQLLSGAGLQRQFVIDAPQNEKPDTDQHTATPTTQNNSQRKKENARVRNSSGGHDSRESDDVTRTESHDVVCSHLHADVLSLPIASGTMKAVAFFHTLDFCDHPHQALREANRVLTDDGELIIVGFNPYSAFGARHALTAWRRREPWNGCFYARHRVSDWLSVLDYRVLGSNALFMRPPINSERVIRRLSSMEKSHRWMGGLGGVYIMHARKQTLPMTTVRARTMRVRKPLAAGSLARAVDPAAARTTATVARIGSRMSAPKGLS